MTVDTIAALVLFALLQIADVATTIRALRSPNLREANRFLAYMMDRLGHGWVVVKLLIAGAAAALILKDGGSIWALWLLNAIYAAVVVNNWRLGSR